MLQFAYTLQEMFARVRSFVFVSDLGEATELFQRYELQDAVAECGGLEYARMRAQAHCASAEAALEALHASPAREQLRASLTYVLERRA